MGTFIFNKTIRLDFIPCCVDRDATMPANNEDPNVAIPSEEGRIDEEGWEDRPLLASSGLPTNGGTFDSPIMREPLESPTSSV